MKGFSRTRIPHLLRNDSSGIFYAACTAGKTPAGKPRFVTRSLETDKESVAKLMLPRKLAEIRSGAGMLKGGTLTLGECAAIYMQRKRDRGFNRKQKNLWKKHKPRSLDYREETLASIRSAWDDFYGVQAALVKEVDCHKLADEMRGKYSASRYNGIMQTLRGLFAVAVESGCLVSNPTSGIGFAEVEPKAKFVPEREQFTEILRLLDAHPRRNFARLSVRTMAFTGLRPNEARHVEASDVNLQNRTLVARETKNGKPRTIHLIDQAVDLFEQEGVAKVVAALKKNPRKALTTICNDMKLPNLTPYTMRYLHLTALVESGVDIGVAADIAGHQDRGVTLLRNYRQTRPEHLRAQIKKVYI